MRAEHAKSRPRCCTRARNSTARSCCSMPRSPRARTTRPRSVAGRSRCRCARRLRSSVPAGCGRAGRLARQLRGQVAHQRPRGGDGGLAGRLLERCECLRHDRGRPAQGLAQRQRQRARPGPCGRGPAGPHRAGRLSRPAAAGPRAVRGRAGGHRHAQRQGARGRGQPRRAAAPRHVCARGLRRPGAPGRDGAGRGAAAGPGQHARVRGQGRLALRAARRAGRRAAGRPGRDPLGPGRRRARGGQRGVLLQ